MSVQDVDWTGKSEKTRAFYLGPSIFSFYCKIDFLLYFIYLLRLLTLCALGDKFRFKKYVKRVVKVCKNIALFNIYHFSLWLRTSLARLKK